MEKNALENSKPDQKEKAASTMEKYKLEAEYDKLLLRRAGNSKRRRDEKDELILVPVPPPFLNPANIWVEFEYVNEPMEVWKRICVEAYCTGWLGFYDNENNVSNHKIFCHWEDFPNEKKEGKDPPARGSKVTVYIDPGPQALAVPLSDPPKPPPPPMS